MKFIFLEYSDFNIDCIDNVALPVSVGLLKSRENFQKESQNIILEELERIKN